MEVLEEGKVIGSASMKEDGLFRTFTCEIVERTDTIRRLFAQKGWQVEYLGIPDKTGRLQVRIPAKRLTDGADAILAMQHPMGVWLPWQGSLDGIFVERGYICRKNGDLSLAIPTEETVKFPAWTEIWKIEKVFEQEMAVIRLTEDEHLPVIDRETGEYRNEEDTDMDSDLGLPDEPAAGNDDSCSTGEGWEEADSPNF